MLLYRWNGDVPRLQIDTWARGSMSNFHNVLCTSEQLGEFLDAYCGRLVVRSPDLEQIIGQKMYRTHDHEFY